MDFVDPAPIDRPSLMARCLNDPSFVRQLLELFANSAPEQARKLRAAVDAGEPREATRMAHTLKGSAANLSAEGLRQVAAEVERLLRGGQTAAAVDLLPLLEGQIKRCVQYLPQLLQAV